MERVRIRVREEFQVKQNHFMISSKFHDLVKLLDMPGTRIVIESSDNPYVNIRRPNQTEGFSLDVKMCQDRIKLKGNYWLTQKGPYRPICGSLYSPFYEFVYGIRHLSSEKF